MKEFTIKPSENIVVLKPITEEETQSGIVVTYSKTDRNPPELGRVICFGSGEKPVDFIEGDTIAYRRYTDNQMFIKGETYNFIEFKDVIAKIEG